jgi:hypothetical protein
MAEFNMKNLGKKKTKFVDEAADVSFMSTKKGDKMNHSFDSLGGSNSLQYQTVQALDLGNLNIDFDEFYNGKVEGFDEERNLFDHYMKIIQPKQDETHHLIWFNRNVIDEIKQAEVEQQKLLEKISTIQKEVENIEKDIHHEKEQKNTRIDRIQILQSLGRPVEADVTYIVPERFTKRTFQKDSSSPKTTETTVKPDLKERTSFLKVGKTGEILVLEKALDQQSMKIYSLVQDIDHFMESISSEKTDLEKQFLNVSEKEFKDSYDCFENVKEGEFQCFFLIQELLTLKYRVMIAQREEIEELEQLHKDKTYFQQKEEELKEKVNKENSSKQLIDLFLSSFLAFK